VRAQAATPSGAGVRAHRGLGAGWFPLIALSAGNIIANHDKNVCQLQFVAEGWSRKLCR
jgi:hypothetical protein